MMEIDDLVKNGTIYKSIMPREKGISPTLLAWLIVFTVLLIPGILLLVFGNNGGFAFLLVDLVLLAYLPVQLRSDKAKQTYMAQRYGHFTNDDFLNLEQQLYNAVPMFNTFYPLEEYLFIPGEGLLLSYLEIQSVRTVQHPKSGATAYFLCSDGEFGVMVADWTSYLSRKSSFELMLRDKKQICLEKRRMKQEQRPNRPMMPKI